MSPERGSSAMEDPANSKLTEADVPDKEPRNSAVFGIKAKLFLALSALAALTVGVAIVAWSVFNNIGSSVDHVTRKSVPNMVTSLRFAELSAEIAATAPAIIASRSQADRVREQIKLDNRVQTLKALIGELKAFDTAPEVVISLSELAENIAERLATLNAAVEQRINLADQKKGELARLYQVKSEFLGAVEPLVDDAVFNLVNDSEQVSANNAQSISNLVEGGISNLNRLLTINAEGNLAAGLLAEALHVNDPVQLQPIRERFVAAASAVERSLRQMPKNSQNETLTQASTALLAQGLAAGNIFATQDLALRLTNASSTPSLEEQERRTTALKTTHKRFLLELTPMVDDAALNLVLSTEDLTNTGSEAIRKLVDIGANLLHVLVNLRAEGILSAGLLNEAASVRESNLLLPLRERSDAAEGQLDRLIKQLPPSVDAGNLRKLTKALIEIGKGQDGMFALRRSELEQIQIAQKALDGSQKLAVDLSESVGERVSAAGQQSDAAAASSDQAIQTGKVLMLVFTFASLLGALVVIFFYVGPRIVRPLDNITEAMSELAAGDTSVDIPGRHRADELGRMAQALGIFRDTAIEVQESNLKEIRDTRRRLSDAIESISEAFSLYDSEDRLVICNSKYKSLLYPGIADEISPGMTFEAIIRRAAERGYIEDAKGRIEDWLTERLTKHREPGGPHVQQRGDGRWIMVSERKTEEGGIVAVYSDITELKQREAELSDKSQAMEQLSGQLAKYLSPQVYDSIFTGKQKVALNSRRKKLTVFFSDIVGFTETADRLESEDLTQLLNHYLSEMSQIALEHGATIDKYVGDAIVIFFGDPESKGVKQDALACVKMAIAMRNRMTELQDAWREAGVEKPLVCRTGINTGFCTVGNFGSEDRMDYTIIGGGVNLAARLESAAEPGEI
ncbi:MAG: PAS-domain containing protein, partial [Hyphomicrobiaceae bacterium]